MTHRVTLPLILAGVAWAQQPVVPLWPNGAPGSEGKTGEEKVRMQGTDQIVSGVHRPSITVYLPPKTLANGTAVVVMPGGSHRELWITHEGYRVAEWLNRRGIAAFVLKYRLAHEQGSTYTIERDELADIQRSIRLVRSRSAEWNVDPARVGIIGFSAGAELAAFAGTRYDDPVYPPLDEIDKLSAKPTFQALIYPPGSGVGRYSKDAPEAFLACGGDDNVSLGMPDMYKAMKGAGVKVEMHIYAGVGHGFGIRDGNSPRVAGWIDRFYEWMKERGWLSVKN